MLQDDGVHLDFDLTPEDFKILDEQESLFLTQHVSRQPESTADVNVISLQSQLAKLQIDFESMKKEKTTKDGEVALLRQKLNTMESERLDALSRHAKKVSSLEQERATLQAHWQRELDKLQTEIKFKDAECNIHYDKSLTTHHRPAAPFASTFGDLIKGKKPRTGLAMRDTSCEVTGMLGSPSRMTLVESGTLSKDINIEDLFSALGFADVCFGNSPRMRLISFSIDCIYRCG